MYVTPRNGAETLYFANRKTEEGIYFKDYMTAPEIGSGYEFVSITKPAIDMRDVLIAINWFGGASKKEVKGEIRLSMNGKTYGAPFSFAAGRGNKSQGRNETLEDRTPANKNWLVVSVESIIGTK